MTDGTSDRQSDASSEPPPFDFDVIVIGGGGAGLAAAITASSLGATCMVLEADTHLGGATALSSGVVFAAGTDVQRSAGVEDSAADMFQYIMTLNQWGVRAGLVQLLSERSADAIAWLQGLGVDFPSTWLARSGADRTPRGHATNGSGAAIAQALIQAAGVQGVEIALGARVDGLLVEDGRVVGVSADDTELRARAVVIATGGFGNNPEMIARLFPTAASHGDKSYSVYFDAKFSVGDGIVLGEAIGANVTGHDTGLLNPTTNFGRYVEAMIPSWVMLVNREGRRFMAETLPYAVSGYLLNEQSDRVGLAIFDERTLSECASNSKGLSPYKSSVGSPTWTEQMIREKAKAGVVHVADSLEDLARDTGIDGDVLAATVERYNQDCAAGLDTEHLKTAPRFYPVEAPPFYAVEVRASLIGSTHAGLEISERAEVLDRNGRAISGLFAAGEVVGGVLGRRYAGGGISLCNAMVFGRLAGANAAQFATSPDSCPPS